MGGVVGPTEGGIAGIAPSDCGIRTRGGAETGGISDHDTGNTSWAGTPGVERLLVLAGNDGTVATGGLSIVVGVFQFNELDVVAAAAVVWPVGGAGKLL